MVVTFPIQTVGKGISFTVIKTFHFLAILQRRLCMRLYYIQSTFFFVLVKSV